MRGDRCGLKAGLRAFFQGIDERTPACRTNTQFLLQLSGYRWVAKEFGSVLGRWVLDAASGMGFGSWALTRKGAKVVGIDVDGETVAKAKRRYAGPHFLRMDVGSLGFRDETFDIVISQDTLEHVVDDARFVQEVHRVLKDAGVFVVFTPHAPVHTTRPANPYHHQEYSASSLLGLLGRFFPSTRLFGRRSGLAMREAEQGLDRLRQYDPLGLRRFLFPRFLRHRLGGWLLRSRGSRSLEQLTVEDIEYFAGAEGSGTLIAVCRKGGP